MSSTNGFQKEQEQLFHSLLKQAEKKGFIRASTILTRFDKYHLKENEKRNSLQRLKRRMSTSSLKKNPRKQASLTPNSLNMILQNFIFLII